MNKLLLMLLIAVAAVGCKETKKFTLDPSITLTVNASKEASKANPTPPYSMETVIRYAFGMMYNRNQGTPSARPIGIIKHDIASGKLHLGDPSYVIESDGHGGVRLGGFLTQDLQDWVIVATFPEKDPNVWFDAYRFFDLNEDDQWPTIIKYDTLAYIPNKLVRENEAAIKKAFAAEEYELCFKMFEESYVFTPITGAEWRALKAKNEQ